MEANAPVMLHRQVTRSVVNTDQLTDTLGVVVSVGEPVNTVIICKYTTKTNNIEGFDKVYDTHVYG